MIRQAWITLFVVIHTLIFCLWAMVLSLFRPREKLVHFWAARPWARGILKACGIRVKIDGVERVDPSLARIYMCNHESYLDIFGLLSYLSVDFKFLLKQELMRIPILGTAMKLAGYIPIDRKDPRRAVKSIQSAVEKIRNGSSILIFPEGTRTEDGNLQDFKTGGFNLALRAQCDIFPVAIIGARRLLPKGSFRPRKGSFTIRFGRPIPTSGYTRKNLEELVAKVREAISAMLDQGP